MHGEPFLLRFRSSKAFLTGVVTYAIFMDQWVFAVIVPVMPFTLHDQVGIPESQVQFWVSVLLAVYGVSCALASPLWGWSIDRTPSRRTPFLLSLLVIFGATVMIWLTHSIVLQVLARVLQGTATAMVWITGLAMIADTVGEKEIGKYTGYLGIGMMIGTLIAPIIGGVVLAKAGQAAVFGITFGLLGIDIIVRFLAIERKHAAIWIPEIKDELASRVYRTGNPATPTPLAANENSDHKRNTRLRETLRRRQHEERSEKWRMPAFLVLLKSKRLLVSLYAAAVQGAIFAGFEGVLPLETQDVFGWDSIGGGLIFLPLTLPALAGPLVGKVCDRYGPRWLISMSFLWMCPILVLMRFVDTNTMGDKVLLAALLAMAGCCFTATLDPLMAECAYIVGCKSRSDPRIFGDPTKAYAQAFAVFNMAWSIGNTIGPLSTGLIRTHAGWPTMTWILGLFCGLTAIPTFLWCGGWYFGSKRASHLQDVPPAQPQTSQV